MYHITKKWTFDAAHKLIGLPEEHHCTRMHGHTYTVELTLASEILDEVGMVVDYTKLDSFGVMLKDCFDHRVLNEVVDFNPTAENLAKEFYRLACLWTKSSWMGKGRIVAVTVKETEKTSATYEE